ARRKSHCRSRERHISLWSFTLSCCGKGDWAGNRLRPVIRRCSGLSRLAPRQQAAPEWNYRTGMIRSFLTVSSGTLASRLLGFLRDAMIAALLGAGPVADAFLVAFQLVNVVRRLLGEGALNAALVPAWLSARDAGGAVAASAFAGRVLGTVSAALIAASVLIGLIMPLVI